MLKFRLLLLSIVFPLLVSGQTVIWFEDFNNGCTDNCSANGYAGVNGAWTVVDVTPPGNFANEWFVSCAENGEPIGSCGAGCGNNATLHVGSVPCSLCLTCPSGDCGAAYNAGPSSLTGEDPTTNKRAISPLINTVGRTNISLHFKYIELGQNSLDDAMIEFSIDGGASWLGFTNTPKTPTTCPGQGNWTSFSSILPSICENIPNLRFAFKWINNDDGVGNDPSFAVDDFELTVPATTSPVAAFSASASNTGCDTVCVQLTDASTGNPSTWTWSSPAATNSPQSSSSPQPLCFTASGTYPITLTVSNSNGSNSVTQNVNVTVQPSPQVRFTATDSVLCRGECTGFTNLTSGSISSSSWVFQGGNPSSSSVQNPASVCYANAGNYAVTLTVTNGNCSSSASISNYVQVNTATVPVVTINGNILSSSTAQSYQWYSVQNGMIAGANQVTYSVTQPGDYYVVITDANGCTAQSANTNMAAPVAAFSLGTPGQSCDTTCVSVNNLSSGNPSQWSWSCPGAINASQSGTTPASFCFTSAGTYTVTLTVSNAIGSSSVSHPVSITMLPSPSVSFTASNDVICSGTCIDFTNLSSGTITTSSWTFQGGNPASSNLTNPNSICYQNAGDYSVTLTVSNGSCSASQTISNYISVVTPVIPTISVNGSVFTSSPAISYQWYTVQNGLISGATQNTFTGISGFDYYVVTTDSNGCTAQSSTVSLAGPVAGFHTLSISPGCDTTCVSIADTSTGSPSSWLWSCPGAVNPNQSGATPAPFCFTQSGTYPLELIVSNGGGTDTVTNSIVVNMLTLPDVNFTCADSILCGGECTNFTNLTPGTISTISWFFSGGNPNTSSVTNPTNICYSNSGIFPVTVTVNNGTCTKTRSIVNYITVSAPATPVITANGDTLNCSAANSYQWYSVQSGMIAGANQSSYIATQTGDYYVSITDINGCSSESGIVHVEVSGIEDINQTSFGIYPNPFNEFVTIRSKKMNQGIITLRLFNISGQLISGPLRTDRSEQMLDLRDLPTGMYTLKIQGKDQEYVYKLIKLKD
ncbi:MAG: PKD domain-containing protein [Bacteroidetes bacterium]|nr:PKD domain-containing protein [Bacteroidota bacterium]